MTCTVEKTPPIYSYTFPKAEQREEITYLSQRTWYYLKPYNPNLILFLQLVE